MSNIKNSIPSQVATHFLQTLEQSKGSHVIRLSGGTQGDLVVQSKNQAGLSWKKNLSNTEKMNLQANNRVSAREFVKILFSLPGIENHSESTAERLISKLAMEPITVSTALKYAAKMQGTQGVNAKGLWKAVGIGTDSKLKQVGLFFKGVAKGYLGNDSDGSKANAIVKLTQNWSEKDEKKYVGLTKTSEPPPKRPTEKQEPPRQEEVPVQNEVSSENLFLKELKKKIEPRRLILEQLEQSAPPLLSEKERDNLVNVLRDVYQSDEEVGETQDNNAALTENQINQIVDVLREIAPDGIGEEEEFFEDEGVTDTTQEQSSIVDQSEVETVVPDGMNADVIEDPSSSVNQEEFVTQEKSDNLDYIDLRESSQATTSGSGPSKHEISELASILLRQPRKKDIQELIEKLTN